MPNTHSTLQWICATTQRHKSAFLERLSMYTSVFRIHVGDVHVTMQIWDIGGQTIGSQMIKNYIFGAQAVLLCYDVTNFPSFQNLEDWLDIVRKTFSDETLPYIALVGNKMDMGIHLHTVKLEKHNTFADENNLYSYRLSAKTGDQV